MKSNNTNALAISNHSKNNRQDEDESNVFHPLLLAEDYPQALVDEYISVVTPPIFATVDMNVFIRKLLGSISLDALEKHRVLASMPTLSQFQLDKLAEVFEDEVVKFSNLSIEDWQDVSYLSAVTWERNCMLANFLGVGFDEYEERQYLNEMIQSKYDTEEKQQWLEHLSDRVLVRWVFLYPYS